MKDTVSILMNYILNTASVLGLWSHGNRNLLWYFNKVRCRNYCGYLCNREKPEAFMKSVIKEYKTIYADGDLFSKIRTFHQFLIYIKIKLQPGRKWFTTEQKCHTETFACIVKLNFPAWKDKSKCYNCINYLFAVMLITHIKQRNWILLKNKYNLVIFQNKR